jgi:hypothetical protein
MSNATKIAIRMTQTKVTPGTVRYDAPVSGADKATVGNVYIQKSGFPDGVFPAAITVTIEPAL